MSKHYVGLDISNRKTSICVVDLDGTIIKEGKTDSDPEAISLWLFDIPDMEYHRVGLEAGTLAQWLYAGLAKAGLPVTVIETRHAKSILKNQTNKTDRNDARGIANMMRANMFKPVHVKTDESQKLRALLACRKLAQQQYINLSNHIRGIVKQFGLQVGAISKGEYEAKVRELIEDMPEIRRCIEPLLELRNHAREAFDGLDEQMDEIAGKDEVCKRLMSVPGVGPFVSLTFRTAIDIPERFHNSRSVGAAAGLTPRRFQSGEVDLHGRISKCGDSQLRCALTEAAMVCITMGKRMHWLKAWGMKLAKKRGLKKACVAVARRLAVILHRIWVDGTTFRWTREEQPLPAAA